MIRRHARTGRPSPVVGPATLVMSAALVTLALTAAACGGGGAGGGGTPTTATPSVRARLTSHPWVLDEAGGRPGVSAAVPATVRFAAGGTVSGSGPCNGYGAAYTLRGTSLRVGTLRTTLVACDPATTAAEHAFLGALGAADRVDLAAASHLVLTGPGGIVLHFRASTAADRLSGTWRVDRVATTDAVEELAVGQTATLTFEADGRLALVTCGSGPPLTWTAVGHRLVVTAHGGVPVATPACAPEGPGATGQDVADALPGSHRVDLAAGQLVLTRPDGTIVLTASR